MSDFSTFISHTRDDGRWGEFLADGLARAGLRVFLRERDIGPGHVILHGIEGAISAADVAILILSAAAMSDPEINDEYAALLQQATDRGLRLIPVVHGAATITIAPLLGSRLWADFRDLSATEHDAKVAALAAAIREERPSVDSYTSGGRLVPVEVLQVARAATTRSVTPPPPPGFVVTYAGSDAEYGERLVDWLERAGLPAWSIAKLTPGDRWVHEIRQRLRDALTVLVVMSPASEDSEDVEREILEGRWHGRKFFPVLLAGDRSYLLATSWYFDARGGALPGEPELLRLRRTHQAHLHGGVVPPPEPELPAYSMRAPVARFADGIPLRRLRAYLKEQEYAHADLLTTSLVLEAAQRLETGWIERADASKVPASLLAGIDAAWSELTGGQQGFRRQLDRYRLRNANGTDFLPLAAAYGWREAATSDGPGYGELSPTRKYHDFVDRPEVPAGFYPTLRNPSVEDFAAWYDRWQNTVISVHLRLRRWERDKEARRR